MKKVCCKDRSKTDALKKKRARNGMVVGDLGDEEVDPNVRKKMT